MSAVEKVATLSWKRTGLGTLIYFGGAAVINLLVILVPDFKTNSPSLQEAFKRGRSFETDWLPVPQLVAFTLLNVLGFVYVNAITMASNHSFFMAENLTMFDIILTVLYSFG